MFSTAESSAAVVVHRAGITALVLAVIVLGALALGVLAPSIPLIGLGGRWHVLGLGAWWMLAALGAALLLAIAGLGARTAVVHRALAGTAGLALVASAVFGSALAAAGSAAATHGARPELVVHAALADPTTPSGQFATTTEVYGHDVETGEPLLVDVYVPPSVEAGAPIVLYLHGGGWMLHDRTLHGSTLRALAREGIVVISADYSLATIERATWQSSATQSACALVWVAANAERFGGDPRRIVLAGDSAGGGLALSTAYRAAAGAVQPDCGIAVDETWAGRPLPAPAGVVGIVPVVDVEEFHANPEPIMGRFARTMVERYLGGTPTEHPDRVAAVDPTSHLTAAAPPTLLVTVEHDHLVPNDGAWMLASAATALDVPVTIVEVPFADHGLLARAEGLGAELARAAIVTFVAGLEPSAIAG